MTEVIIRIPGAEVRAFATPDDDESIGWLLGKAVDMLPAGCRRDQILAQAIRSIYEGNDVDGLPAHDDKIIDMLTAAIAIDKSWDSHDNELNDAVKRHQERNAH